MEKKLFNTKVAILATDGFEESEFTKPVEALKNAGAQVEVIALKNNSIRAWAKDNWGDYYMVDRAIANVDARQYDAVVLPGGVFNPDQLRMNEDAVRFVATLLDEGKPVAAICHGPWLLVETGMLKGRTVTSYPSIKCDLINAGAYWVDRDVVVDNGLITSRHPHDLPVFCKTLVDEIAYSVHSHIKMAS
jgi:protease I